MRRVFLPEEDTIEAVTETEQLMRARVELANNGWMSRKPIVLLAVYVDEKEPLRAAPPASLPELRAAVIEAANRVDHRNRATRVEAIANYRAAARAYHEALDATDWSHRAPLENWYEDYASDFEEN